MKTYIIYRYLNKKNGKVYIGQTCNESRRKYIHLRDVKKGSKLAFHRAIREYGIDNFEYSVMVSNLSKSVADCVEIEIIKLYNSTDSNFGYNIHKGGRGGALYGTDHPMFGKKRPDVAEMNFSKKGIKLSDERKKQISELLTGRFHSVESKIKMSKSRSDYYKTHITSDETRLKLSIGRIGKTGGGNRQVRCIETGEIYISCRQAGIAIGKGQIGGQNIRQVAIGKWKTAYGFTYEFLN